MDVTQDSVVTIVTQLVLRPDKCDKEAHRRLKESAIQRRMAGHAGAVARNKEVAREESSTTIVISPTPEPTSAAWQRRR